MKYQREAGQHIGDFFKTGKIKFRFAFEFISAVAGADSDSKGIDAGAFYKFNSLVRVGVSSVFGVYLNGVFDTGKAAEFCFYNNAFIVCVINYPFGQFDVFFKRVLAAVNHNGSEASVNAGFADFKIFAMVKMQADWQTGIFNSCFDKFHQINMAGIFTCACGNLQN